MCLGARMIFALKVLFLIFFLLLFLIAPAFSVVFACCLFYGYQEFTISRRWKSQKLNDIKNGEPIEALRSDSGLFTRYLKYCYLPLFTYCFLIYIAHLFSGGNDTVQKSLL